ncbi:hypothetical protein [Microbulbifer discodermiae]|uniref:hypothetical protein n=1 Tax=Microbulbifer sp. 2201CG32-9 TaxID=3232309 RepID=UPI00345BC8E3
MVEAAEPLSDEEVLEEICNEVARRHGLLLTKDDPVLVTVTLNRVALRKVQEANMAAFETLRNGLEEIYLRQAQETKDTANKLVGAALRASEHSISDMSDRVATAVAKQVEESLAQAESRIAATAASIRFDRTVSVCAAVVGVIAGLSVLVALALL